MQCLPSAADAPCIRSAKSAAVAACPSPPAAGRPPRDALRRDRLQEACRAASLVAAAVASAAAARASPAASPASIACADGMGHNGSSVVAHTTPRQTPRTLSRTESSASSSGASLSEPSDPSSPELSPLLVASSLEEFDCSASSLLSPLASPGPAEPRSPSPRPRSSLSDAPYGESEPESAFECMSSSDSLSAASFRRGWRAAAADLREALRAAVLRRPGSAPPRTGRSDSSALARDGGAALWRRGLRVFISKWAIGFAPYSSIDTPALRATASQYAPIWLRSRSMAPCLRSMTAARASA